MEQIFIEVEQNYYITPLMGDGMGKCVYVEVEPGHYQDQADFVASKLTRFGFDLEDRVPLDPYSEDTVLTWNIGDRYNWLGVCRRHINGESVVIFLDDTWHII